MELKAPKQRHSVAEYLDREKKAAEKHEYRNGEIVMMAGGTRNHSRILVNCIVALDGLLKGSPCQVFESNHRIGIPRAKLFTYPDLSVICNKPEPDPNDPSGETSINPRLILEVLSPSTENYDRGDKFTNYLQLDSLQEYVIVTQSSPRVDVYFRQSDGSWLFTPAIGLQTSAKLRSLQLELSLSEIYAGIEFPT